MADVFISYSKARPTEATDLAADIEGRGYTVWWDKDLTPGESFTDVIKTELGNARAVIVIWFPASVISPWVNSEATRALKRKVLIPVYSSDLNLDDIPQPFDTIHLEPLANRDAIFAALEKLKITSDPQLQKPKRGLSSAPASVGAGRWWFGRDVGAGEGLLAKHQVFPTRRRSRTYVTRHGRSDFGRRIHTRRTQHTFRWLGSNDSNFGC